MALWVTIGCLTLIPGDARGQYFLPSRHCSGCHPVQTYDWKQSAHARAATGEYFLAQVREHILAGGAESDCLACHAPLAVRTDWVWEGYSTLYRDEGVTCDVCHKIVDTCVVDGTGQFDLEVGRTRYGPLLAAEQPRHPSVHSPLFRQSRFCAGCHERRHPEPVSTFSEWSASRPTESCQDCHMPGEAGFASVWSTTPRRERVAEHTMRPEVPALRVSRAAPGKIRLDNATPHSLPTAATRNLTIELLDATGNVLAERRLGLSPASGVEVDCPTSVSRLVVRSAATDDPRSRVLFDAPPPP